MWFPTFYDAINNNYSRHINAGRFRLIQRQCITFNTQNELTLPNINKALKRWMNKQDKTDIEEESNIIVSNALEVVYQELRRLFAEGENGIHF